LRRIGTVGATSPATLQLNVPAQAMEAYTHDFVAQFPYPCPESFASSLRIGFAGNKSIQPRAPRWLHVFGAEMPFFVPVRMALLEFQHAPSGEEELRTSMMLPSFFYKITENRVGRFVLYVIVFAAVFAFIVWYLVNQEGGSL
jgi:hypothetical protein